VSNRTTVVSYVHASTQTGRQAGRQAWVGGWWSRTRAALSFICGASYLVFVFLQCRTFLVLLLAGIRRGLVMGGWVWWGVVFCA